MTKIIETVINKLSILPGIGKKRAIKITMHLLKWKKEEIEGLAKAIESLKNIRRCKICFNISEKEICDICEDQTREKDTICVVEEASNITTIEKTGIYRGLYHVLGGVISPIDGIGPENLHIKELIERIKNKGIKEIIIATNPTTEGELTAQYLSDILKKYMVKITRIARGMPAGTDIDLADEITIGLSIAGRETIENSGNKE